MIKLLGSWILKRLMGFLMAVWINLHEWYLEPGEEWKALNASINDLYSLKWSYIEKQRKIFDANVTFTEIPRFIESLIKVLAKTTLLMIFWKVSSFFERSQDD